MQYRQTYDYQWAGHKAEVHATLYTTVDPDLGEEWDDFEVDKITVKDINGEIELKESKWLFKKIANKAADGILELTYEEKCHANV